MFASGMRRDVRPGQPADGSHRKGIKLMDLADQSGGMGGMMQDLAFAIPGVDEAMGFAEIMKSVPLLLIHTGLA